MSSLPSKSTPQRWEIEFDHQKGMIALGPILPDLRGCVEVMPVSEHERLRGAVVALHAYLWTGTPDADDLQAMMLITKRALDPESKP